jgi:signal transduction histidine kinase
MGAALGGPSAGGGRAVAEPFLLPVARPARVSPADAVPVLISYFDADHVCRFANEHHVDWYGRSPAELVGLHMRDFLGEAAYGTRLPYLDIVARGQSVSLEAEVPHRSGTWREAAIRYVPLMGPRGFEGFHTLVFDLSREQHRFHSVFDGTAIGFWEIDLSNVRDYVARLEQSVPDLAALVAGDLGIVRRVLDFTPVLAMNEKARQILGCAAGRGPGRCMGWWCPDASLEVWNQVFLGYLAGQPAFEGETVMRREDGALFNVLISAAYPKNRADHVVVVVGLVDISERVAREQALARAQQELAHAARVSMLGEMVASITHEVNQPLAAVVANGHAALRWLSRRQPDLEEAKAAIRQLVGEAGRASQIIHRTRRMAFKETGEPSPFDLHAMLREAVEITRSQVTGLGARLALDKGAAPGDLLGDRIQLQQVIINLIINAAQAMADMPEGTRDIALRVAGGAGQIAIEVTDTGPGFGTIAPDRVFEAFFTTKKGGMGMGLSVSRSIVESHGGTIEVGQTPGGGALFRVCLPHRAGG